METKTVHKWLWVWDFDKEEDWLNEMAQEGWALESVGFCTYTFRRCEPGEYIIRLEMRSKDQDYEDFLRETGAELIGRVFLWIYCRRKAEYGPFDLFSDIDSKITHLQRICRVLFLGGMANLIIGVANSLNPGVSVSWINLLCATLLMYALGRIQGKKEALEKERKLHE